MEILIVLTRDEIGSRFILTVNLNSLVLNEGATKRGDLSIEYKIIVFCNFP